MLAIASRSAIASTSGNRDRAAAGLQTSVRLMRPTSACVQPIARAMTWTRERIERLTLLWADRRLTATDIAAKLNTTRNSVIGKAHRLGLPHRKEAPARKRLLKAA